MKRVISIILAIAMIAMFAAIGVSADEIQRVDASCETGEKSNATEWTVTKKYFAIQYTMKNYHHEGDAGNNGCCGIIINGSDGEACVFIPYDGSTPNNQIKFGPWWDNTKAYGKDNGEGHKEYDITVAEGADAVILLLGEVDGENCTYTCYFNGEQINVWGGDKTFTANFNGQLGWATKLAHSEAEVLFVESDTVLGADAFAAAPKTGSATAIVAAVAVLALAGAAVASKKH